MNAGRYQSWGRWPSLPQQARRLCWRDAPLPLPTDPTLPCLPFGNGRSYGDSCLTEGGVLLDTRGLDRFMDFDPATGVLRCEAGVLLGEILELVVPRGWFLAVTPGTRFVTVGGAIANDVHGKNHHRAGSFGCHLRRFELLRGDGRRRLCSPTDNPDWFAATVGGLGLTGVILWAELALRPLANPYIQMETLRFGSLDGFFELADESDRDYEYTVAWVDCLARGKQLGRGLFMRGNHAAALCPQRPQAPGRGLKAPFTPPLSLVGGALSRCFNSAYYHKQHRHRSRTTVHYQPFFYPLDGIGHWNRLYGPAGFFQYQCVVPREHGQESITELLERIAAADAGSPLSVLKVFGARPSPGWLSFPRPGVTLALDFPNRGASTLALLERLDEVVAAAGGAVYPAKEARISGRYFRRFYPQWQRLEAFRDPRLLSRFWQRVTRD